MKPELFLPDGWINVEYIASRPTWLKVLIGARQVGKTYGTLLYHLRNNIQFILLRRTTEELRFIGGSGELDPFTAFLPEYHTRLNAAGGFYNIVDYNEDGVIPGSNRGIAMSLPQVAHVRGFDGSRYKSIVFDEAVPEKGVRVLRTEGDALLNAYTTIAGNRELRGEPPVALWLLCNTNNINSPILEALDLTDDIVRMKNRGTAYIEHDGVSIFQGSTNMIAQMRKDKTVLARRVRSDSAFAQMAYNNEWAYDQSPLIKQRPIKGMTPLCSYDDRLFLWEDDSSVYVCGAKHKADRYSKDDFSTAQFVGNYLWLKPWYANGMVTFADVKLLAIFKQIFNIDF